MNVSSCFGARPKDKAKDPLGVCSVNEAGGATITCPIRFRQEWLIADDAAAFFFPPRTNWTSLTEIRLNDKYGQSAGNIDVVLVAYDDRGRIIDFGALEVQAVYISGNVRQPFDYYMENPAERTQMNWVGQVNYPRPDYLSSSRKRLAPQLIYKGGILQGWGKKTAVALHKNFYASLPTLPEVASAEADMAWLLYDLALDPQQNRYKLVQLRTVYTQFTPALVRITTAEAGPIESFVSYLQSKLDEKMDGDTPPDAPILTDVIIS